MNPELKDGLEDYLSGTLSEERRRRYESLLKSDPGFEKEVSAMKEMSGLFATLKSEEAVAPAPAFYARVVRRIEKEQESVSLWSLLFDPLFARRVAFASLVLLAVMGSFLATVDREELVMPTPDMVMAEEFGSQPLPSEEASRDMMLVRLASFQPGQE